MTNEKRPQDGERMEMFDLETMKYPDGSVTYCTKDFKAGFNKGAKLERERVLYLVMEEAEKSAHDVTGLGNYLELSELKAIISKLRGEQPIPDKFSPEYLAEFKQAQKDMPNVEKYFGEGKEDE